MQAAQGRCLSHCDLQSLQALPQQLNEAKQDHFLAGLPLGGRCPLLAGLWHCPEWTDGAVTVGVSLTVPQEDNSDIVWVQSWLLVPVGLSLPYV